MAPGQSLVRSGSGLRTKLKKFHHDIMGCQTGGVTQEAAEGGGKGGGGWRGGGDWEMVCVNHVACRLHLIGLIPSRGGVEFL